ncbi:MAG: glutamine--fructose-6-phosphate transaminase (isomerizing) [Firmicutes bacterium]|nr:glutamine--fructose-6-phosphate transaminase (isomerizing) [Bacillota bacterium]
MCGVIGFLGPNAVPNTVDGLESLEYRGYDSAGVSFQNGRELRVIKSVGNVAKLRKKVLGQYDSDVMTAIGHTRWATHGGVSEINTHPHISYCGKISVVHNGIIENYKEVITFLQTKDIEMKSQTDTEVIPHLISYYLDGNLLDAVKRAKTHLRGSYSFLVTCATFPNVMVAARHGRQPLTIGVGNDFYFVTSDIPSAKAKTDLLYALEDDEFAVIKKDWLVFYNDEREIKKKPLALDIETYKIDKEGYSTFMEKEIFEIPNIIRRIITEYKNIVRTKQFKQVVKKVQDCDTVHIAACGTAYHAGLMIAQLLESKCRIRTRVYIASEVAFQSPLFKENDVGMVISQSGETADTMSALRIMKESGLETIGICNVAGSSISRQVDYFLPIFAGTEVAVASTKAYIAQVVVGAILVWTMQKEKSLFEDLSALAQSIEIYLESADSIQSIAKQQRKATKMFILGKGLDFVSALESALKIKEITYKHCEGFAAGELKHGTLSLVDKDTLTIVINTEPDNQAKKLKLDNASNEVMARGSRVWIPDLSSVMSEPNSLSFILGVIPSQLFALYLAQSLKLCPDKPRNLAKAVTVE